MFSSSSVVASSKVIMAKFATSSTRRNCMELSNPRGQTINLSQLKNQHSYNTLFHDFIRFDQTKFTNVLIQKRKKLADYAEEESTLMKEFKDNLRRLEGLVEDFRVLEMEKFMGRVKGETISMEEQAQAEILSREMVREFLEKPFKYFSREDVKLEDKLDDLKVLVGIFEQGSCSGKNQQAV